MSLRRAGFGSSDSFCSWYTYEIKAPFFGDGWACSKTREFVRPGCLMCLGWAVTCLGRGPEDVDRQCFETGDRGVVSPTYRKHKEVPGICVPPYVVSWSFHLVALLAVACSKVFSVS